MSSSPWSRTVTIGCRARAISLASAAPSTNFSVASNAECELLIGQKSRIEVEFGIERPLDVVGAAEAVLLAVKQETEERDAPLAQCFDHCFGLLRRDDLVFGSLKKGHRQGQ